MRPIGVAEGIGGRCCDHCDVNVNFTILNGLPAASMRTEHAHAAHFSLSAVIAERAVHAAFNVMDCS